MSQTSMSGMLFLRNTRKKTRSGLQNPMPTMVMTMSGTRALRTWMVNIEEQVRSLETAGASLPRQNRRPQMKSAAQR